MHLAWCFWFRWAATSFVDCKLADAWGTFLPLYNTGGFTDTKLRVRFDA